MNALRGLAWLLVLQAVGESLVRLLHLPFPGPIVGFLLLLPSLAFAPVRAPVAAAADVLLSHLSLLFVPVGVGVLTHLALVSEFGGRLLGVILVSTLAGMAVTALLLQRLWREDAPPAGSAEPAESAGDGAC